MDGWRNLLRKRLQLRPTGFQHVKMIFLHVMVEALSIAFRGYFVYYVRNLTGKDMTAEQRVVSVRNSLIDGGHSINHEAIFDNNS